MAARALVLAGLAIWTWSVAAAPMGAAADSVLHLTNLVFHEAGHVIFALFGRFMGVLGGSLLQVLVPLVAAAAFLRQQDRIGIALHRVGLLTMIAAVAWGGWLLWHERR